MGRKRLLLSSAAALLALSNAAWAQAPAASYPADAQPGQCFARVIVPEVATTVNETVLDAPQRTETRVVPARFEMVDEQVLVREAGTEYRVAPATYRTVTETVVVEPQRVVTEVAPARVETYTERVLVRPAYTTWKPGRNILGRSEAAGPAGANGLDLHTGELLCRVEVPAEYTTITRTRTIEPAGTQTRIIPARTQQVTREVMVTPSRVEERATPPQYRTVKVRREIEPARTETVIIPATYRTVQRRTVHSAGGVEWREVLCETNTTPERVRDIQAALTRRGYPVRVDGAFGAETLAAMERFQRANGLPVGYMTIETVRALGVSMPAQTASVSSTGEAPLR